MHISKHAYGNERVQHSTEDFINYKEDGTFVIGIEGVTMDGSWTYDEASKSITYIIPEEDESEVWTIKELHVAKMILIKGDEKITFYVPKKNQKDPAGANLKPSKEEPKN